MTTVECDCWSGRCIRSGTPFARPPFCLSLMTSTTSESPASLRSARPRRPPCAGVLTLLLSTVAPTTLAEPSAAAAPASPDIEFNRHFLIGGASHALDLASFEAGRTLPPGVYTLDVHVNDQWVAQAPVRIKVDDRGALDPCLSTTLLDQWGVDAHAIRRVASDLPEGEFCTALGQYIVHARAELDTSALALRISIPDLYLHQRARDWVDPSQWDAGITAGLLEYTANAYRSVAHGQDTSSASLGLRLGANAGAWRLRHTGFLQWEKGRRAHRGDGETYLQRDIHRWNALLTVGEGYSAGDHFNSIGFTGIRLMSDERMLPQSQRGYAPVIQGDASSPARVRIYQQGRLLHETRVAAGPFAIEDLYATAYNGDLEVVVTGSDGREERFIQPFSSVPQLLRPGQTRFSLTAGRATHWSVADSSALLEATWRQGVDNRTTLQAGARGADQFQALALGASFNTAAGALALDIAGSKALHPAGDWWHGHAFRASYSRAFPLTDTHVSVAAYRHASGRYLDLGDLLLLRGAAGQASGARTGRQRDRLEFTLSQSLSGKRGRLWGNGQWTSFREGQADQGSFSLGYSASAGPTSYAISARRSWLAASAAVPARADTSINLTFSTPLGKRPAAPNLLASASRTSGGEQMRLGVTGTASDRLSYTAGIEQARGRRTGADAGLFYQGNRAAATFNASGSDGSAYAAAGLSGGAVLHPGGITLAAALGETVGLVHAAGAQGARVDHDRSRIGRRGYALVPHLTPYRVTQVHIDPLGAASNLRFTSTSARAVPTAGAVAYFGFATRHEASRHAFTALLPDGRAVPFGATILGMAGEPLGIVGQNGQAWFATPPENTHVTLRWHGPAAVADCEVSLLDTSASRYCQPSAPAAGTQPPPSTYMEY